MPLSVQTNPCLHSYKKKFRLVPRLKSLRFMLHYPELVQDCKPDIVAATAACEEVRRSKKFGKLLEIILLIGNIMNTGSRNAESVGFDISYLPKLCNTKDRDNKSTLLHFLVETVEKNHPELLNFHDELMHLEKSARVSIENVQKSLKQMDNNIKNLETDLKNARNTDPDDRFVRVDLDWPLISLSGLRRQWEPSAPKREANVLP